MTTAFAVLASISLYALCMCAAIIAIAVASGLALDLHRRKVREAVAKAFCAGKAVGAANERSITVSWLRAGSVECDRIARLPGVAQFVAASERLEASVLDSAAYSIDAGAHHTERHLQ